MARVWHIAVLLAVSGLLAASSACNLSDPLTDGVDSEITPDTASEPVDTSDSSEPDSAPPDTSKPPDTAVPDGGCVRERCNARDDDCDGSTDEGCPCLVDGSRRGVCENAAIGEDDQCHPPDTFEVDETSCDEKDNDCDGTTDEGCDCNYMGNDKGVCSTGTTDPGSGTCNEPTDYEDPEASCDSLDNDCDGKTDGADSDLNCDCQPGNMTNCYTGPSGTRKTGICTDGTKTCKQNRTWESCKGDTTPKSEGSGSNCDDKDSDCDGVTDEGCFCAYDPGDSDNIDSDNDNDTGVCRAQSINSMGKCSKPGSFEDPETSCDGLDNDCDSVTDENCSCVYDPGDTNSIDRDNDNDNGVCTNQTIQTNGTCSTPNSYQKPESNCADSDDNDCDGTTDCSDADCSGETCSGPGTACASGTSKCQETNCSDGSDNDSDGDVDSCDSDCSQNCGSGASCRKKTSGVCNEVKCSNGTDDDGDGAVDCADSDCSCGSGKTCCTGSSPPVCKSSC